MDNAQQAEPTQATPDVSGEAETPTASSTDPKTGDNSQQPNEPKSEGNKEESQAVPYERFKEVNEKAKRAEEYEQQIQQYKQELESLKSKQEQKELTPQEQQIQAELKKHLQALGYVSREELQRQREDEQVKQELASLESKYDGSDGRPKFDRKSVVNYALDRQIGDLDAAYKAMHHEALIDWAVRNASQKTKGVQSERSDGSGVQSGESNEDLMINAYRKGDKDALLTRMKKTKLFQRIQAERS